MTSPVTAGWAAFPGRVIGAALLRPATYEDVEADPAATPQAVMVVVLSSACAGLGMAGLSARGAASVVLFSVLALALWAAWSLLAMEIGVRVMPSAETRSDLGELLRTTGFASGPGMIRILGVVPAIAAPVLVISTIWMLAAMIVAIRQALDYTTYRRAIAVCLLGWLFAAGFAVLFGLWFGPGLS